VALAALEYGQIAEYLVDGLPIPLPVDDAGNPAVQLEPSADQVRRRAARPAEREVSVEVAVHLSEGAVDVPGLREGC
jgi:hypothetical protein